MNDKTAVAAPCDFREIEGFSDLCSHFFDSKGYIDIAPDGAATQSSLSKWSKPDDPQRALRGGKENFAFHTDREMSPWWQLDFGVPRHFRFIYIENRRPPYHNPELQILVEISGDGAKWQEVHRGLCSFGSDISGVPLLIDLGDAFTVQYIRIRINESSPVALHLKRVRVLASGASLTTAPLRTVFLATRSDGLCQRLLAIMNANLLAQLFDGEYGFLWEDKSYHKVDQHTVSDKTKIFSKAFLAKHAMLKPPVMRWLRVYADRPHTRAVFDDLLREGHEKGFFLVHQATDLDKNFPFLNNDNIVEKYRKAFDDIQFNPAIREAIQLAHEYPLPEDAVVVHVRGGDIVHGKHSYNGVYRDKALSALEIEGLIARLPRERQIFLIGQEADLIEMLATFHNNVTNTADFTREHNLNDEASVLFDVVLMSRARDLYSGNSAVSQLAARIGTTTFHDVGAFNTEAGASPALLNTVRYRAVSNNQKCYSFLKLVLAQMENGHLEEAHKTSRNLVKLNPENVYFRVLTGLILSANGRTKEAEKHFAAAVEYRGLMPENTLEFVLMEKQSKQDIIPASLITALDATDEKNHPFSALVHSLYHRARRDALEDRNRLARLQTIVEARSPALAEIVAGFL